jgi:hypothetical protein
MSPRAHRTPPTSASPGRPPPRVPAAAPAGPPPSAPAADRSRARIGRCCHGTPARSTALLLIPRPPPPPPAPAPRPARAAGRAWQRWSQRHRRHRSPAVSGPPPILGGPVQAHHQLQRARSWSANIAGNSRGGGRHRGSATQTTRRSHLCPGLICLVRLACRA